MLGVPVLLFSREPLGFEIRFNLKPRFAMTGDGERFYFFRAPELVGGVQTGIIVLEGWAEELSGE